MTKKPELKKSATERPARMKVGIDFSDHPSITKQSHRDECDINHIIARYDRTGLVTHLRSIPGEFLDVSEVGSYREAMHRVRAVEDAFFSLSAADRATFQNDPAQYLDYASQRPSEDQGVETPTTTPPEQPAVTTAALDPLQMDHTNPSPSSAPNKEPL